MNIKDLLQDLTTRQIEIYSKIGNFIEMSVDYPESRCNIRLQDGTILYDVKLNADDSSGSYTKPKSGAYVIVTFLSKEDAFVSLISNSDFIRIETANADNTSKIGFNIKNNEGERSIIASNVTEYTVKTTSEGTFSILDRDNGDAFIIRDVDKIRLGINNGTEILLDNTGISITTTEGKIKIGNDILTLKTILTDIIDTLVLTSFTNTAPATLTPDAISTLNQLRTNIINLFE